MGYTPKYLHALDIKYTNLKHLLTWIEEGVLNVKNLTNEEQKFLTERLEEEARYYKRQIENIQLFLEMAKNPDELLCVFCQSHEMDKLAEKHGLSPKMMISALSNFRLKDLTAEGISKVENRLSRLCLIQEKVVHVLKEVNCKGTIHGVPG